MKVTIQIRVEVAAARPVTVPLHIIDRACDQVQDVGLVFGDAKSILGKLQQALVQKQLDCYLSDRRACPHCGTPRARTVDGLCAWQCRDFDRRTDSAGDVRDRKQ